jgi:methylglutaconyl-CoA hydratase
VPNIQKSNSKFQHIYLKNLYAFIKFTQKKKMDQGSITTFIHDKIATITFEHHNSNSLTAKLLNQLTISINKLSNNPNIHIVIIKSEGEKTFCAGASFDELMQIDNHSDGKKFFMGFANVINAIRKSSKIIVGRIQGKAVGGGVGLIAACDYAMGLDQSNIKLSEIAIGIGPFVIEPAVSRKIGKPAFAHLTLNPDKWFDTNWAKENKLFDEVFSTIETLDMAVEDFTKKLANYSPNTLLEIKKILWEGTENWDELLQERAEISGKLVLSEFTKKALKEFKK